MGGVGLKWFSFVVVGIGIVAAHYHYIREIPMFAEYEIQLSIGGFEDKWVSVSLRLPLSTIKPLEVESRTSNIEEKTMAD